jgi:mannosyltransferase
MWVAVPVICFGIALRFWTSSDMWLDEALTVNISILPVTEIHGYLMRDGSPPLYYYLLHFWMQAFGTSNGAIRALSGVFSVATLPCVWIAGRRLGGRTVAVSVTVLVATSPFAVYYGTEARMYSLVAFLTVVGFLALDNSLRKPTRWNLVAVAAITALLLYAHYWSLYLVGMTGLVVIYRAWRGPETKRHAARMSLAALVVGCVLFVPWVPTFIYQSQHTGTPWATPANFADLIWAFITFGGGPSNPGFALTMLYFAIAALGIFGFARNRSQIVLELRGNPKARGLAIVLVGTATAAVIFSYFGKATLSPRYASVIFIPLLLLVAMGINTFADRRIACVVLVLAGWWGFDQAIPNIWTQRSQAVQIAAALDRSGQAQDVVAYCPDQLGPDASRLLPDQKYQQITFPRGISPKFVDWVNYAHASGSVSVFAFADRLEQMAGSTHSIWYVWAPGYATFGNKCQAIQSALASDPNLVEHHFVAIDPGAYYESMQLVRFAQRS